MYIYIHICLCGEYLCGEHIRDENIFAKCYVHTCTRKQPARKQPASPDDESMPPRQPYSWAKPDPRAQPQSNGI